MKNKFYELFYNTIINEYMEKDLWLEKLSAIKTLAKEITPSKVFRYRKISDFALSDFDNDILSLSSAALFNDPYDSLIRLKKENFNNIIASSIKPDNIGNNINNFLNVVNNLKIDPQLKENLTIFIQKLQATPIKEIQQLVENNVEFIDNLYKASKELAFKYLKTMPKIACFSEDIESILMWSHYADSHKGFALEYNLKNYVGKCDICGKNCDKSHYEMFYPVRYANERFDVTPLLTYIANYEIFSYQFDRPIIPIDDQFIVQKALLNKSTDWSYEKEWRLMSLGHNNEPRQSISLKPTAIYLGVEISDINKKILITLAKEKNIKIYQMFIDIESPDFKLEYQEIE